MISEEVVIRVTNISKTFKLPHERTTSIKSAVVNFYKKKKSFEKQQALKDISFEVKKGEFFGIVGRNGSGKSTMLKMLAGIYSPSSGSIHVNGKLTPFIELGVGFNPELTGRENVFLNGALLGFNRRDMEAMYDEIVSFAEIEKFMDQKLKNYSSGMQVRLAFSIAIRAETDILLIDEVLAVGDAAFQQKCYETFSDMKRMGRTMVLVTHDMSAVSRFCDRALLIHDGVVQEIGKPKDIANAYLELNYNDSSSTATEGFKETDSSDIKITDVSINKKNEGKISLETGSKLVIDMSYLNPSELPIQFGLQIFNEAGNYCFGTNTLIANLDHDAVKKGQVCLSVELNLLPGNYSLTVAVTNEDATKVIVYRPNARSFRITKTTDIEGIANLNHSWSVKDV